MVFLIMLIFLDWLIMVVNCIFGLIGIQARKMQESGWKPQWFAKDKASDTYRYIGGYWEARERGNWDSCPDIFGQFPSEQLD